MKKHATWCSAAIVGGLLAAGASTARAQATPAAVQLLNEAVDIAVSGGKGALDLTFTIPKKGASNGDIRVIAPVSTVNQLPQDAVTVRVVRGPEPFGAGRLITIRLTVDAPGHVRPGVVYKGYLVAPGLARTAFTVQDRDTYELAVTPDASTFRYLYEQPAAVRLFLKNTGTGPITVSDIRVDLTDAASQRAIHDGADKLLAATPGNSSPLRLPLTIERADEKAIVVAPPLPKYAGSYAGRIDVMFNGGRRAGASLTVVSRGPNLNEWTWMPFVLFACAVFGSALLSFLLDYWFGKGGGLLRADTLIAIANVRAALMDARERIAHLASEAGVDLRVTLDKITATEQLASRTLAFDESRTEREAAAVKVDVGLRAARLLASDLEAARGRVTPGAATRIEALGWPADEAALANYGTAVAGALKEEQKSLAGAKELVFADPERRLLALRWQKRLMSLLYRMALGLVIFFVAYIAFYATKPAFGTVGDYFAVILWGLGLTEAGAQVLARVKAPART